MFGTATFETNDKPRLTGKNQYNENFPVGSFLLSKTVRPLIRAFYLFARTADDIADDPVLDRPTKLAKLNDMDHVLHAEEELLPVEEWTRTSWNLKNLLQQGRFTVDQPRALLRAFRRDVVHADSQSWADLLDYCSFSANPVGRFLLEIHHETTPASLMASDALCTALQVLNHLQDCHKDFTALNRVYVPADWLAAAGIDRTVLGARLTPPELLRVFDHTLDKVGTLMTVARDLPSTIVCRRFRIEAAVIVVLALRLMRRLRQHDLLAHFHGLQHVDWIVAVTIGVATGLSGNRPNLAGRLASQKL